MMDRGVTSLAKGLVFGGMLVLSLQARAEVLLGRVVSIAGIR
jgi:hypothetical protein